MQEHNSNKLKSKISFNTSDWSWQEIIDYETIEMKESVKDYVNEVLLKQSYPEEYDEVVLATVELKHIRKVRKLLNSIIDYYKGTKILEYDLTYYEHKLIDLVEEAEADYELIANKFNINIKQTSSATALLIFYNNKIVKSKLPIKELLQYSDKIKIDKYVMMNKMESMLAMWKEERHMYKSKEVRNLDLNCKVSYAGDEVIINEDYEDL